MNGIVDYLDFITTQTVMEMCGKRHTVYILREHPEKSLPSFYLHCTS